MLNKNIILDVGITNATERDILEYIFKTLEEKEKHYFIVTPNPEILVFAHKHKPFQTVLNTARLALPDGVGIIGAGKILGKPFKERVTGTDLVDAICKESVNESKRHVKKPITVGFLGGRRNVAETTAECLREKYPGLRVAFAGEFWPDARGPVGLHPHPTSSVASLPAGARRGTPAPATPRSWQNTTYKIPNTIDILFVAFGFPKQEGWMYEHVGKEPVRVMLGVGGAFDYISGRVGRAPVFLRSLGLEWLYRLIRQPWRIKRQLALFKFLLLILKEKVNS